MILPPRTLAIRLFFWTILLGLAVWNLSGRSAEDLVAEAPPPAPIVPVPLPGTPGPPVADAPAIVDVEAAVRAMDATLAQVAACGVPGTFNVRLGPSGLAEAWIRPPSAETSVSPEGVSCAAKAAWGASWPATTQGFEMEREIPGS